MIETEESVEVQFPVFVAMAIQVLPIFLEAIQGRLLSIESLWFCPGPRKIHPERGEVRFNAYGNSSVTFFFIYHPGEKGTQGSLELDRIQLRRGEKIFEFEFMKHNCVCPACHGMKYPFRPVNVARYSFESYSEDARLYVIRQFVGGVH